MKQGEGVKDDFDPTKPGWSSDQEKVLENSINQAYEGVIAGAVEAGEQTFLDGLTAQDQACARESLGILIKDDGTLDVISVLEEQVFVKYDGKTVIRAAFLLYLGSYLDQKEYQRFSEGYGGIGVSP